MQVCGPGSAFNFSTCAYIENGQIKEKKMTEEYVGIRHLPLSFSNLYDDINSSEISYFCHIKDTQDGPLISNKGTELFLSTFSLKTHTSLSHCTPAYF